MLSLFVLQQLYSVHLADQTEDCTVQLADHIKVMPAFFCWVALKGNRWHIDTLMNLSKVLLFSLGNVGENYQEAGASNEDLSFYVMMFLWKMLSTFDITCFIYVYTHKDLT